MLLEKWLLMVQQPTAGAYMYMLGNNSFGQIGNNTSVKNQNPTQIGTLSWGQISEGTSHTLAIRSDGKMFSWGGNTSGQLGDSTLFHRSSPVQIGTNSWTSVSTEGNTSYGIRNDGLLFAWGNSIDGEIGTNSILFNNGKSWTSISTYNTFGLGIMDTGLLYAWGENTLGSLGITTITHRSAPTQVGVSFWSTVATTTSNSYGITSDGKLFAWGGNAYGQVGVNDLVHRSSPVQVGASSWSYVGGGQNFVGAINTNGLLFTWGVNGNGQLGDGTISSRSSPVQIASIFTAAQETNYAASKGISLTRSWSQLAAGANHCLALDNDGVLYAWGNNVGGQLGTASSVNASSPVPVGTSSWTSIASGDGFSLACRADGYLFAWGVNNAGQLGLADLIHRSSPTQVGTSSWTAVAAGQSHVAAIEIDGSLFAWGLGTSGQLGDSTIISRSSPIQVGTSSWTMVGVNGAFTQSIRSDGSLFAWGLATPGQLGQGVLVNRSSPVQVTSLSSVAEEASYATALGIPYTPNSWSQISSGQSFTVGITSTGALYTWGANSNGQLGDLSTLGKSKPIPVGTDSWSLAKAGDSFVVALRSDNMLFTWGYNANGQLGLSDLINRSSPTQVGTSSWTAVAAGDFHSAAIRSDGGLFTWGYNGQGQLGNLSIVSTSIPSQIGTGSWTQIAAGGSWTSAIYTDGGLFTWGGNAIGQLGLNDAVLRSSPVQVGTSSWSFIASGGQNSSVGGIRTDGLLFIWGANTYGQIGDNTIVTKSSPVQIGTNSWTFLRTGPLTTTGITSDGLLYTWGRNDLNGTLGIGNVINRSSPVQVGTSSWTYASVGADFTGGITTDGALFMWGNNSYGALGRQQLVTRSSPVQVQAITDSWSSIATGYLHTLGIRNDGSLWAWGENASGQLGINTAVSSLIGVRVDQSNWSKVGASGSTSSAVRSDGALFTWGLGTNGQLADSTVITKSSPVQIGYNSWLFVTTGVTTGAAVTNDYKLYTWGSGTFGQLGNLTSVVGASSPTFVKTINESFTKVIGGVGTANTGGHLLALRDDGLLFGTGQNDYGQIANTLANRSAPVQIGYTPSNGYYSVSFNGSSTFLTAPSSTGFSFDTGDFTVEMWVYATSFSNTNGKTLLDSRPTSTNGSYWIFGMGNTGIMAFTTMTTGGVTLSDTQNRFGQWVHYAAVRSGTTVMLFANGKMVASSAGNTNNISSSGLLIGANAFRSTATDTYFLGNVSNVRVVKGTAVYTANFTPPDSPLTAISGTTLLTCQSSTFVDNSVNNFTITATGPVAVAVETPMSNPIGTSASYTQIASGVLTSGAIQNTGALWIWGLNNAGQIGNNTIISRSSPTQVGSSSWSFVSLGQSYTSAVRSDGGLFAWGLNTNGNLGNDSVISRSSPVQLGTSSWSVVSTGQLYMSGLTYNNYLFTWGSNGVGQLGIENAGNSPATTAATWLYSRSSPTQVGTNYFVVSPVQVGSNSWNSINSGVSHVLGVRTDGTLYAWGINTQSQLGTGDFLNRSSPVQIGTSSWSSVSAGFYHSLAINTSGALYGWGSSYIPNEVSNPSTFLLPVFSWKSLSSGSNHTAAVRDDGALFVWGNNASGQLGTNDVISRSSPIQIGTSSWSSVSAGFSVTMAIRNDGALFTWGIGTDGVLGTSSVVTRSSPIQIGTSSWTQVSLGLPGATPYALALRSDNLLFGWGNNASGVIGLNDQIHRSSPTQVGTSSWNYVAAGNGFSLGILSTRGLFSWGTNGDGRLGQNSIISRSSPVQVGTSSWLTVATGQTAGYGITAAGTLFAWGLGGAGQLGTNDAINRSSPVQIGSSYWSTVSGGVTHAAAINTNGNLFIWGLGTSGQLGLGDAISRSSPVQLGTGTWKNTNAGGSFSLGVASNGVIYEWGTNATGQLGNNSVITRSSPVQVGTYASSPYLFSLASWSQVSAGQSHSLARATNNSLWGWGNSSTGTNTSYSWSSISGSASAVAAIRSDGALFTWGAGDTGQLGTLSVVSRSSPTQIGTSSWTTVSMGAQHTMAIRIDGGLFAWGLNTSGQFGDNTIISKSSPVQVGTSSWSSVAAGTNISAALRADGGLFTWGLGTDGIAGNNTAISRSSPVQVGTSSWSFVNASDGIYAITSNKLLFAWGLNSSSQLGQGDTVSRSSPVQLGVVFTGQDYIDYITAIGYSSSISQVSSSKGGYFTGAILSDKSLWTWGVNTAGQLGRKSIVDNGISVIQVGSSSWSSVSTGSSHMAAIRSNGSLFTWGINSSGGLGTTDILSRSSPVQIGTSSWTYVSSGSNFTAAIRNNGLLYAWGDNAAGQLGLSDIVNRSSPTQVGVSSWTMVVASSELSLGIRKDGLLFSWGAGGFGSLGDGVIVSRSSPIMITTITTESQETSYANTVGYTVKSWSQISDGGSHTAAITSDGELYLWGDNVSGQIGSYEVGGMNAPKKITTYSWNQVSAGLNFTTAIRNDGALFVWGNNAGGQLGLGDIIHRSNPVQIGLKQDSGFYSGAFDGTGDYLIVSGDFRPAGNFTFEMWVLAQAFPASGTLFTIGNEATSRSSFSLNSTGALTYNLFGSSSVTFGTTPVVFRQWTHVAFVRSGSTVSGYINGVLAGTQTISGTLGNSSNLYIGSNSTPASGLTGYISNFRYVDGTAVYTTDFTPPTGPLGPVTNTKLLTCADAYFIDTSGNNYQITKNGNAEPSDIQPFSNPAGSFISFASVSAGPSTTYAVTSDNMLWAWGVNTAAQIPSQDLISRSFPTQVGVIPTNNSFNSVYFDGTGDFLTVGGNFIATSDFTIEGWFFPTALTATTTIFSIGNEATSRYAFGANASGTLYLNLFGGSNTLFNSIGLNLRQWQHVAIVRSGSTVSAYINGISAGSQSISGSMGNSTNFYIGGGSTGGAGFTGYISNFRYLTGVVQYTAPFTPPTSPLTSITGTTILTCQSIDLLDNSLNMSTVTASGNAAVNRIMQPFTVSKGTNVATWSSVYAGGSFGAALDTNDSLWSWGTNTYGNLGVNDIITRSNPVQIAASPGTGYYAASGGYFTTPANSTSIIFGGTGLLTSIISFTVEMWIYQTARDASPNRNLFGDMNPLSATNNWGIYIDSSGYLNFSFTNTTTYTLTGITTKIPLGVWSHIAVTAELGVVNLYVDGVKQMVSMTAGLAGNFGTTSTVGYLTFGQYNSGATNNKYYGYVSNIRVSSGAVYTGDFTPSLTPLTAGDNTSLLTAQNSTLVDNSAYNFTITTSSIVTTPYLSPFSTPAAATSWSIVSAGLSNIFAIEPDNTLWGWGINANGQLGKGDVVNRSSPTQIGSSWNNVAAGQNFTTALSSDNLLFAWGFNTTGPLGLGDQVHRSSPTQVGSSSWNFVAASMNTAYTHSIANNGRLYGSGVNSPANVLGNKRMVSSYSSPTFVPSVNDSFTIADAGLSAAAAIRSDGLLFTWGFNSAGMLGTYDVAPRSGPTQIGNSSWTTISTNLSSMAAIKSDNTLYTWGIGTSGQLGFGDLISRSSPTQVGTSSWTQVNLGFTNGFADRIDNTYFTWGPNTNGMLGLQLGATATFSSPVVLSTANVSFSVVNTWGGTTLALTNTSKLFTWGLGTSGQLGDNTITTRSYGRQISTYSWSSINAGSVSSFAIRNDGVLFGWGLNTNGQLSLENVVSRSSPTQIGTFLWKNTVGKTAFMIGNRYDNTFYSAGLNTFGQLGVQDTIARSSPTQVSSGSLYVNNPNAISTPTQIGGSFASGFYSTYFNATGYLLAPNNAAFDVAAGGNFTYECWLNIAADSSANNDGVRVAAIAFNRGSGSLIADGVEFSLTGNSAVTGTSLTFTWYSGGSASGTISSPYIFVKNRWYHVAVVRNSNVVTIYINGTATATTTNSAAITNGTNQLSIGGSRITGYADYFNGYISNFRITNTAVYTSNFTPPTTALTSISGTVLLTAQDNTFKDNSTNNFTITSSGSAATSTVQPFTDAQGVPGSWTLVSSGNNYSLGIQSNVLYTWGYNPAAYASASPNNSGYSAQTITAGNSAFGFIRKI